MCGASPHLEPIGTSPAAPITPVPAARNKGSDDSSVGGKCGVFTHLGVYSNIGEIPDPWRPMGWLVRPVPSSLRSNWSSPCHSAPTCLNRRSAVFHTASARARDHHRDHHEVAARVEVAQASGPRPVRQPAPAWVEGFSTKAKAGER